jgi:RNA polymerase sigma-70 factor (ECF subfamily)
LIIIKLNLVDLYKKSTPFFVQNDIEVNSRKAVEPYASNFDQKSFTCLYQSYSQALFGVLQVMLKNPSLAEDALQNTFIKIWLHRSSYDAEKGTPFTWMLNIAQNEAKDILRSKQYRQTRLVTALEEGVHLTCCDPSNRLDYIALHKMLFILPPLDRSILELCFLQGFSCPQVSKLLGLPLGTVKTRMQRSYRILKSGTETYICTVSLALLLACTLVLTDALKVFSFLRIHLQVAYKAFKAILNI